MLRPEDHARIMDIVDEKMRRINAAKAEITGETGDSSQYGGLLQSYAGLKATYLERSLSRQESRRFTEITTELERELGLFGFDSVLRTWQEASERRQVYRESHPDPKPQV